MTDMTLRVESAESFRARTMAMARALDAGDLREQPAALSFETMDAFLKVITASRWTLLRTLRRTGPSSIRALAGLIGRDYRNVHGDVTALIETGLVERDASGKINVPWSRVVAEMDIEAAA